MGGRGRLRAAGGAGRPDPLQQLGHDDRHRRRADGGEQGGRHDAGRIGGAGGGAQADHARRQQGDAGGVDGEEQHHGVGRRALKRVEPVELLHGADAERRRGVAEAEHVGGDVHDHRAHGRVLGRDLGKQPRHQRPDQPRYGDEQTRGFAHLHDAEEQRHDADQADGQLDGAAGAVDDRSRQRLHCRDRRRPGRGPAARGRRRPRKQWRRGRRRCRSSWAEDREETLGALWRRWPKEIPEGRRAVTSRAADADATERRRLPCRRRGAA